MFPVRDNGWLAIAIGVFAALWLQNASAVAPYGSFTGESNIDPNVMQIDEPSYLGTPLQRDFVMVDSHGKRFALGEMLGKPLILLFSYYGCGGSCPIMNTTLKQALQKVERFKIGADYRVLTVSFDKHDTPETMRTFVERLELPDEMQDGWRHAVMVDKESDTKKLSSSVGYQFFWSRADEVFLHPNAVLFITPEGRVARYLYGTAMEKSEVELALIDADWGRIANSSNVIDILTGVCYSYNFAEGKYTVNLSLVAGVAALAFGILMVAGSAIIFRKKAKFQRRLSNV